MQPWPGVEILRTAITNNVSVPGVAYVFSVPSLIFDYCRPGKKAPICL